MQSSEGDSQIAGDRWLSEKLRAVRSRFLQDVDDGQGKNWTVVMGNESGGKLSLSYFEGGC